MLFDFACILDDVLESKYRCKVDERKRILTFLLQQKRRVKEEDVTYIEGFVLGDTLVCFARKEGINVRKFIYLNVQKNKSGLPISVDVNDFHSGLIMGEEKKREEVS